jgi:hypothetical protein
MARTLWLFLNISDLFAPVLDARSSYQQNVDIIFVCLHTRSSFLTEAVSSVPWHSRVALTGDIPRASALTRPGVKALLDALEGVH